MHRTGPLTVVEIQSWGVFSLLFAGRVTLYNTIPLCFPHSKRRKVSQKGETCSLLLQWGCACGT